MDLQSNVLTITKVQNGSSGAPGRDGANGYNAATLYIYQRSANGAPAAPSNTLTYNFVSGTFTSGSLGNWSQQISEGTDPCYVAVAAAISNSTTNEDYIESSDWTVRELVRNGEDGSDGQDGAPGYNQATIYLYQRTASTTVPSKPTGLTYKFSTGVISGNLGNWQQTIPDGTNPCYITSAVVISTQDENNPLNFSTPVKLVEDGENGQDGQDGNNFIILSYYKRSSSLPTKPSGTYSYNFSTQTFSGGHTVEGWTDTIPESNSNHDPCYVSTIIFLGNTTTVSGKAFSDPIKLVEDGKDANSLRIITNTESILKFPVDRNDKLINYSITPDTINISLKDKENDVASNLYTTINIYLNEIDLNNIIEVGNLNRYLIENGTHEYYTFNIDQLYNEKNSEYIQDNYKDFLNDFFGTSIPTYIKIQIEYNDSYAYKYLIFQTGITEEAARLSVEADGIFASIVDAGLIFDSNGLIISNGNFIIKYGNEEKLYFNSNDGSLRIVGNGIFTGTVHATDGEFEGTITSTSGNIGGFTIDSDSIYVGNSKDDSPLKIYSGAGDSGNSKITVTNIDIGSGANITDYLQIGNLKLLKPTQANNNNVLTLIENNTNYFLLNNNGNIDGQNWSIKKENNDDYVTARFGRLVAKNGEFEGTISASTIGASTFNVVNFVTQKTRAMGGSFIFRPTFNIENINKISNYQIEFTLDNSSADYLNIDLSLFDSSITYYVYSNNEYEVVENLTEEQFNQNKTNYYYKDYVQCDNDSIFDSSITYYVYSNNEYEVVENLTEEQFNQNKTNYYYKDYIQCIDYIVGVSGIDLRFGNIINISSSTIYYIYSNNEYEVVENLSKEQFNQNKTNYYYKDYVQCDNNSIFDLNITYYVYSNNEYEVVENLTEEQFNQNKTNYYYENYVQCDSNSIFILDVVTIKLTETDYNDINDNYNTLILFGYSNQDIIIGINSDENNSILPPRALVMEKFERNNNGFNQTIKLLLGDLTGQNLPITGYGLYAENVYLRGSLVTESSANSYAGVNTEGSVLFDYNTWSGSSNSDLYQNDKIIFWGGAPSASDIDIQKSPFIVTDKGNIFARSGEFKGSVISDSTIANSIIKAPIIYGNNNSREGHDSEPSLKIYDTGVNGENGGIGFYQKYNNIGEVNENDDVLTLSIDITGFTYKKNNELVNKKFIEFNNDNDVIANLSSANFGETLITQNQISNGDNSKITINDTELKNSYGPNKITVNKDGIINTVSDNSTIINKGTVIITDNVDLTGKSLKYMKKGDYYVLYVS